MVVILVVCGSSTSSMFIFRGNSRTFRVFIFGGNSFRVSAVLLNDVFTIKLVRFCCFGASTSWMFIFGGNSRSLRLFNFFDVHFSW